MPKTREVRYDRQVVVRLPGDLYAAIEQDAADNGRTVAQSVRFWLERAGVGQ